MSIYLGIDIGTSGTKTLAIRENGRIVAKRVSRQIRIEYHEPTWEGIFHKAERLRDNRHQPMPALELPPP